MVLSYAAAGLSLLRQRKMEVFKTTAPELLRIQEKMIHIILLGGSKWKKEGNQTSWSLELKDLGTCEHVLKAPK